MIFTISHFLPVITHGGIFWFPLSPFALICLQLFSPSLRPSFAFRSFLALRFSPLDLAALVTAPYHCLVLFYVTSNQRCSKSKSIADLLLVWPLQKFLWLTCRVCAPCLAWTLDPRRTLLAAFAAGVRSHRAHRVCQAGLYGMASTVGRKNKQDYYVSPNRDTHASTVRIKY